MSPPYDGASSRSLAALSTALVGMTAVQPASAATGDITFTKVRLSPATDLDNPMRGQFRWMGYGKPASTWPASDVYCRDQASGAGSSRPRASTTSSGSRTA